MAEGAVTSGARSNAVELRKEMLRLVLSVAALDAVAISVLYATHLLLRPVRTRYIYGAVWIALTLLIVLKSLTRIRAIRLQGRMRGRSSRAS